MVKPPSLVLKAPRTDQRRHGANNAGAHRAPRRWQQAKHPRAHLPALGPWSFVAPQAFRPLLIFHRWASLIDLPMSSGGRMRPDHTKKRGSLASRMPNRLPPLHPQPMGWRQRGAATSPHPQSVTQRPALLGTCPLSTLGDEGRPLARIASARSIPTDGTRAQITPAAKNASAKVPAAAIPNRRQYGRQDGSVHRILSRHGRHRARPERCSIPRELLLGTSEYPRSAARLIVGDLQQEFRDGNLQS